LEIRAWYILSDLITTLDLTRGPTTGTSVPYGIQGLDELAAIAAEVEHQELE
jgi:hypothetical protein